MILFSSSVFTLSRVRSSKPFIIFSSIETHSSKSIPSGWQDRFFVSSRKTFNLGYINFEIVPSRLHVSESSNPLSRRCLVYSSHLSSVSSINEKQTLGIPYGSLGSTDVSFLSCE